jgi:ZIP family zinc transporter
MLEAGGWALLAASSLVVGAFVAQTFQISRSVVGEALGFGAGALVGALAYELIPNDNVSDVRVWVSFGAGALVFYVTDGVIERRSAGTGNPGRAIALGALLDGVPESIVLGMSLAVGGEVSIGFLVAVFVSNAPESLSATAELKDEYSPAGIYRMWGAIALVSAVAGAVGYLVADALDAADGRYVQAFAGGAVLTMLADTMMPEAFAAGGRRVALLTALGFAIAAVLTTLESRAPRVARRPWHPADGSPTRCRGGAAR